MEEKTGTMDAMTYPLMEIFPVVATKSPFEYEGTYGSPEAQPARFLLKLSIRFPPPAEEDRILRLYQGRAGLGHPLDILGPAPTTKIEDRGSRVDGTASSPVDSQSSILDPRPTTNSSPAGGLTRPEILTARQAL